MAKKRHSNEGESLEPSVRVDFRRPWVMIVTLAVVALILASIYLLMG